MAVRKWSAIASGGAIAGATDKVCGVRSGTTDLLLTPVALDLANVFLATQTVGNDGAAAGTGVTRISPTMLGSDSTTAFLKINCALPTTITDAVATAVILNVATGGSSASVYNYGLSIITDVAGGGFTGNGVTSTLFFQNNTPGTGTNACTGGNGNFGVYGYTGGTTTGQNVGLLGQAFEGSLNVGVVGSCPNGDAKINMGVVGCATDSGGTSVGGYFGLIATNPNASSGFGSAALIANNGAIAAPIALFQANHVTKLKVDSAGLLDFTASSGAGALLGTLSNAPATGNPQFWVPIKVGGVAYWVPAWHV